jgi:hypothetical protein
MPRGDQHSCQWRLLAEERERVLTRLGLDRAVPHAEVAGEIDAGLAAAHLIHVEPLGSSVEYGWMEDFAGTLGNARLRDLLEVALAGRGAFRRFKDVLLAYPVEREAWFAFRDGHVRAAARDWLEENGIDPTTAPPRRRTP